MLYPEMMRFHAFSVGRYQNIWDLSAFEDSNPLHLCRSIKLCAVRPFEVHYDMRIKPQLHFKVHSDEFPPFLIMKPRELDYTPEWTLLRTGVQINVSDPQTQKYSSYFPDLMWSFLYHIMDTY